MQFTSSGSGLVNSLVSGEAVIGLGMMAQAVTQINDGINLKIVYFEIENYPSNIVYADMSNNSIEEKEGLLSKWVY